MKHYTFTDGLTLVEALFVLFLGFKLTGHIDWSWWWVVSPMIYEFTIAPIFMKYIDKHIED